MHTSVVCNIDVSSSARFIESSTFCQVVDRFFDSCQKNALVLLRFFVIIIRVNVMLPSNTFKFVMFCTPIVSLFILVPTLQPRKNVESWLTVFFSNHIFLLCVNVVTTSFSLFFSVLFSERRIVHLFFMRV